MVAESRDLYRRNQRGRREQTEQLWQGHLHKRQEKHIVEHRAPVGLPLGTLGHDLLKNRHGQCPERHGPIRTEHERHAGPQQ